MNSLAVNALIYSAVIFLPLVVYLRRWRKKEAAIQAAAAKGQMFSDGPKAQHPRIDISKCIGCGSCVDACPEGDVLGLVGGRSAIINGHKCIGHGLCVDACPMGTIELVMAAPSLAADMPWLTPEYETSIQDLFIVGELGGLALIKNAINQGRDCIDTIAGRRAQANRGKPAPDVYDVCIVGAGPGGISASLRAIERKLSYVTIEQDEIGGTVAKYPRKKLVLTSPVSLPLYGSFNKLEISKENLLEIWNRVFLRANCRVNSGEKVEDIKKDEAGIFTVLTSQKQYRAQAVVLALGRRGTPRKLGVPGEDLPKVMYALIEADAYTNSKILVVGGGDSAIEAAMGLAHQTSNEVTLSYRKQAFSRIKERNAQRIQECIDTRKLQVVFNSMPVELREKSVLLEVNGEIQEMSNDYVWIFAGGTPPNTFLEQIGVQLGIRDMTREVHDEAVLAKAAAGQRVAQAIPSAAQ